MSVVLDASALLALLFDEPGGAEVESLVPQAVMSSVNWSEVLQKAEARGADVAALRVSVLGAGLQIHPLGEEDAVRIASLWRETHRAGLSFCDRACLALAQRLASKAVTADHAWAKLKLPVMVIR